MSFTIWVMIVITGFFLNLNSTHAALNGITGEQETLVYAFRTEDGKVMTIAKGPNEAYLVYRFGTAGHLELEFPHSRESSWKKFVYSYYLRGGGEANEALELNYLTFVSDKIKYIIYNIYSSRNDEIQTGIRIINLRTNTVSVVKGIPSSIEGNLVDLRNSTEIVIGQETYD